MALGYSTGEKALILLIDNYDSFTYNVADLLRENGAAIEVFRNDRITIEEIERRRPQGIVISPGPGRPQSAGISIVLLQKFAGKIPLLGICLGHQAIGAAFGGKIVHGLRPVHGKTSMIHHHQQGIFDRLPSPFPATRYHSLVIERASLPQELEITAETKEGEIMGIRHRSMILEGVQFHPESILTEFGDRILQNFLSRC